MFVCDQVLEYSFVLEAVISGPFRLPSNSKMNGIISLPAVNDGFKPDLMFWVSELNLIVSRLQCLLEKQSSSHPPDERS